MFNFGLIYVYAVGSDKDIYMYLFMFIQFHKLFSKLEIHF